MAANVSNLTKEILLADANMLFGKDTPRFNPSALVGRKGLRIYDRMRLDEQVRSAMAFKKNAVMAAGWAVSSPEGQSDDWEPRVFVEDNLTRLDGTIEGSLDRIMTALDFGYSVTEKIYEPRDDGRIWLKALKTRRPHEIVFAQDAHGNLLQIIQQTGAANIEVPRYKVVLYSYGQEFDNHYGTSDFDFAYRSWWHKDNATKWLGMFLEKLGIPPIFLFYNPNIYQGQLLENLKTIVERLQAATAGIIPRGTPEDIEPWTPEFSAQVGQTFIPALDRFDTMIAKAILMPSQLGVSPETSVGSQARAATIFKLFMSVVSKIRKELTESIIEEQIIKQLVDLNFNVDVYPKFELLDITDDVRLDLFETWSKLVAGNIVRATDDDERHIRESLQFPEMDEAMAGQPRGPQNDPQDPGEDDGTEGDEELTQDYAERTLFFQQLERKLDAIEDRHKKKVISFWEGLYQQLAEHVRLGGLGVDVNLDHYDLALAEIYKDMHLDAFRLGYRPVARMQASPKESEADAIAWLLRWGLDNARGILGETKIKARQALAKALEVGDTTQDAMERLRQVFEPLIGSRILRKGKPIPASRVENIVRTETTTAYNHGVTTMVRQDSDIIDGVEYAAILDTRTTHICEYLDGKIFRSTDSDIDRFTPPNHYQCRSVMVPVPITRKLDEKDFITAAQKARGRQLITQGFS